MGLEPSQKVELEHPGGRRAGSAEALGRSLPLSLLIPKWGDGNLCAVYLLWEALSAPPGFPQPHLPLDQP